MSVLTSWVERMGTLVSRVLQADPDESSATPAPTGEQRSQPRVPFRVRARIRLHDATTVWCEVMDATAEGVRLALSRPVLPGTFADVEIPFDGRRLCVGMRIQWVDGHGGQFNLGARLLGRDGAEESLNAFQRFLRRLDALRHAA